MYVIRKDNNPLNNRVSNLYWGTQKENIQQCIKDGRLRPQGKVPLDIKTRESIRRDYLNTSLSRKELEKKYDITHLSRYLNTSRMRYRLSRKLVNDLILDKEEKGFTNRELSKKYKISKACVSHYLNRYKPKI